MRKCFCHPYELHIPADTWARLVGKSLSRPPICICQDALALPVAEQLSFMSTCKRCGVTAMLVLHAASYHAVLHQPYVGIRVPTLSLFMLLARTLRLLL